MIRGLVSSLCVLFAGLATCGVQGALRYEDLAWYTQDHLFEPVEPAPWVSEAVLKVFYTPSDLSDAAAVTSINALADLGVKAIHTGAGPLPWPTGLLKDPSRRDPRLLSGCRLMKQRGMRVVAGIYPFAPAGYAREHQQYRVMTTPDSPAAPADHDWTDTADTRFNHLGLFTPYGDWAIEAIAEIVSAYGLDGVSFDGHYHERLNYNPVEQEMFTRETGRPFPKAIDLANEDYIAYQLWADQRLEDWYRRLHRRLREINPEAVVYTWTVNAGRYGHFLTTPRVHLTRMNLLFDAPVQEWWLDEVNLGSSVVPAFGAAYVRAVAGDRVGACDPYVISRGNPYSAFGMPAHELKTRCLMAMTNGSYTPLGTLDPTGDTAFRDLAQAIHQRARWVAGTQSEPWAAVLVSEQTRQFYALNQTMDRFLQHALGVFRVGVEEHLPMTLITDLDITPDRLKRYAVLVLPNSAALSDRQVSVIREYVRNGGGLVATCETSLCNEFGQLRPNFALADLFGVDYLGRPNDPAVRVDLDANFLRVVDDAYWRNRAGIGDLRWAAGDIATDVLVNDRRMPHVMGKGVQGSFKGPWVLMSEQARAPMLRAMVLFPLGREPVPAAVAGRFGNGRVVYFAVGLDAACYSYCYPYQRLMMSSAIRWAAAQPAPFTLKGPMCVQSTLFRQKDASGERLVMHLFNGINSTAGHGAPDVEVPLREESVPIHGMTLRLPQGPSYGRIHIEPGDQTLVPEGRDGQVEVQLPPLDIHYLVVVELQ